MNGARPSVDAELDLYLKRLRFSLAPLPTEEREEIVREIHGHLAERIEREPDPSTSIARALAAMGPPEECARAFLDDYRITTALAGGSGLTLLHEALRITGRGLGQVVAFMFFLVLFTVAIAFVVLAVLKPIFPGNVGMWVAPTSGLVAMGFVDSATAARAPEVLGYWFVPLCVALGVVTYRLATILLGRFLRNARSTGHARGM